MGIKNVKLDQAGLAGVKPRFIYIETDNTVAEVQVAGYLNQLVENFSFSLDEQMMALVSTKTSPGSSSSELALFDVSKSGSNWSLIANDTPLGADAVATANIQDEAVTLDKLADGIEPSHVVKFAGKESDGGGSATIAITVTGALAADLAFAQVEASTNAVEVQKVTTSADTVTVLLSGDPGAATEITYQVLRAAS